MDIERIKKISEAKINAGKQVRNVRNTLKEFKHGLQDVQEELSEVYKPIVKAQEEVKEAIDEKQDKLIKQLKENQSNIIQAIEYNPTEALTYDSSKLPEIDWDFDEGDEGDTFGDDIVGDGGDEDEKDEPSTSQKKVRMFNLDKGITTEYKQLLKDKGYELPSEIFNEKKDVSKIIDKVRIKIKRSEDYIKSHSTKKGEPLKNLKTIEKTTYTRNKNELPYFKDYLKRLEHIKISPKYIEGTGYTQPKRNAYKISSGGKYGNLIIDVPKLMGQLHLVAKKDGEKVLDKKVDFDTLDLLTKRFNSKKKYSDLSKMVFNQLNKLSEIPIHRTSKKFSKLGSGVVYYNDISDLVDRMELLGGAIMAGNDGAKSEMSEIVHKLYEIGKIDNNQLNDLLKSYVIQM